MHNDINIISVIFRKNQNFAELFSEIKIGISFILQLGTQKKKLAKIEIFGIWNEKYCFKIEDFQIEIDQDRKISLQFPRYLWWTLILCLKFPILSPAWCRSTYDRADGLSFHKIPSLQLHGDGECRSQHKPIILNTAANPLSERRWRLQKGGSGQR